MRYINLLLPLPLPFTCLQASSFNQWLSAAAITRQSSTASVRWHHGSSSDSNRWELQCSIIISVEYQYRYRLPLQFSAALIALLHTCIVYSFPDFIVTGFRHGLLRRPHFLRFWGFACNRLYHWFRQQLISKFHEVVYKHILKVRWWWVFITRMYKDSSGIWQCKNFENRSTFARVTIKSQVHCF